MARVPSTMLALGTRAPSFSLPDPSGKVVSSEDFADASGLLVMFICPHCPFVRHVRPELATFARDYQPRGLAVVAINSNDVAQFPGDAPEKMAEEAKEVGYTFPYLYDESQEAALAYHAACTPDFYLFDGERKLVYRGQLDGSRPGNDVPVTGADLRRAADALLAGKAVSENQMPSLGCNIKWKPGNAPDYFGE